MNEAIKEIEEYLKREQPVNKGIPVIDILYSGYSENIRGDEDVIKQAFGDLDAVLSKLTLKEYDRVWDAACGLCDKHERRGFLAGLRIGAGLMLELAKNEQGKDSCF